MTAEVPVQSAEFGKRSEPKKLQRPGLDQVIGYIREKNSPEGVEIFKDAKEGTDEEKINRIFDGLVYTLTEVAEEAYKKRDLDPNYGRVVRGMATLLDFVRLAAQGQVALERRYGYEVQRAKTGGGEVFAYRASFVSNGRRCQGDILNRVGLGDIQGGPDQKLQFRTSPITFGELGEVNVRIDWDRDSQNPNEPPKVTYDLEVYLPGREEVNLVEDLDLTQSGQAGGHQTKSGQSFGHHWPTVEVLPEGRKQFRRILEKINQTLVASHRRIATER